jgi:WD40 repeat protein
MKKKLNTKGALEALLVIGLILIIPLFFVMRTAAEQSAAPNTLPPTAVIAPLLPTAANAPEDNNAMKPKQPPACTFPLADISAPESMTEEYTFSEPQVVLNDSYNLVEWLPDNQQLLMTDFSDQIEMGKPRTEIIELYNSATGEIKVYATHPYADGGLPAWQPELNAVVYPVMNFMGYDKTYQPIFTRQLWVSYGNPDNVQMLADNMSQFPIAAKPDGSEMFYLADKKIAKLDKSLKKLSSALFDPAQWDYGKGPRNQDPIFYKMVWQPNTSLVFLYSSGGITNMGSYTFIMNADTGKVCELNFSGLWASKALWSSDGRYLATIRTTAYSASSGGAYDLAVLDTVTGKLHTTEVLPPSVEFERSLDDFAWAPDNRHLLVSGRSPFQENDAYELHDLYLVDFMAGQSVNILPDYTKLFLSRLAWSSDGTKLAVNCTTNGEYKLCLLSVNTSGN